MLDRVTTLEAFLEHCVETCEPGARNEICYRAALSLLYASYRGACFLRDEPRETEEAFLAALLRRYPHAVVENAPCRPREIRYLRYLGQPALEAFWRRQRANAGEKKGDD